MITKHFVETIQSGAHGEALQYSTFFGLSSDDPKPTEGVGNGSAFIEMDTSKVYFYDAENEEWKVFAANG